MQKKVAEKSFKEKEDGSYEKGTLCLTSIND